MPTEFRKNRNDYTMHRLRTETCENCKYWDQHFYTYRNIKKLGYNPNWFMRLFFDKKNIPDVYGEVVTEEQTEGHCRYNPPPFHKTGIHEWCNKWQENNQY